MNENLNSAEAFAIIDSATIGLDDWKKIDELFGLDLIEGTKNIDDDTQELIKKRDEARANKDWATSDEMRDELAKKNIAVKDTPDGSIWQYLA